MKNTRLKTLVSKSGKKQEDFGESIFEIIKEHKDRTYTSYQTHISRLISGGDEMKVDEMFASAIQLRVHLKDVLSDGDYSLYQKWEKTWRDSLPKNERDSLPEHEMAIRFIRQKDSKETLIYLKGMEADSDNILISSHFPGSTFTATYKYKEDEELINIQRERFRIYAKDAIVDQIIPDPYRTNIDDTRKPRYSDHHCYTHDALFNFFFSPFSSFEASSPLTIEQKQSIIKNIILFFQSSSKNNLYFFIRKSNFADLEIIKDKNVIILATPVRHWFFEIKDKRFVDMLYSELYENDEAKIKTDDSLILLSVLMSTLEKKNGEDMNQKINRFFLHEDLYKSTTLSKWIQKLKEISGYHNKDQ